MIRLAFRIAVFAIAIAAAIDPPLTVSAAVRPRIAIVAEDAGAAARVRDDVAARLAADFDLVPHIVSDVAAAVVVGDRYPDASIPDSLRVLTVTTPSPGVAVRLLRISAPRSVPAATRIRVEVDLEAHGAAGRTTQLHARIAGVNSAAATHRWTAADERWHASLDVVPVGAPPFVVRVSADTAADGAARSESSAADTMVRRRAAPFAVEFADARPSWASTFVRRALEADARFLVDSVEVASRGLAVRTTAAVPLADPQLDRFDAVVVGGLERVTASDVAGLERYMRERGGAVVLLPDQRIDAGPLRPLLPDFTERLLESPVSLVSPSAGARLRASELLVAPVPGAGSAVVMQMPSEPGAVIVTRPYGAGRLLVSGAMDAWRDRGSADAAFDRFWQATIAGLALATPEIVEVAVEPPVLRPHQPADLAVRVRAGDPASITASFAGQPVRLVPGAERGAYRGRITAGEQGTRPSVEIEAVDSRGRLESVAQPVPIVVDAAPAAPRADAPLWLLAAAHHGIDVPADRAGEIAQALRQSIRPPRAAIVRRPMRSPWWLIPFITCLSAEWWLRRRRGLR